MLIPDGHPEARCEDCGKQNVVWHTLNELWNRVIRPYGEVGPDPILCPSCFILRAEGAGLSAGPERGWIIEPAMTGEQRRRGA